MHPDMSLKIIWPWIFVLSVRTEGTDITRRFVDQSMPNHLILPLESLAAFTSRAAFDRAVMRSVRGVNVGMRI